MKDSSAAQEVVESSDKVTRFWIALAAFTFVVGGFQASITMNLRASSKQLAAHSLQIADLLSTVSKISENYIRLDAEVKKDREIADLRHLQ